MQDKKQCDMCKKKKKNVSREPSSAQLLFGGFRVQTENRCPACEREVAVWVEKQIKSVRRRHG